MNYLKEIRQEKKVYGSCIFITCEGNITRHYVYTGETGIRKEGIYSLRITWAKSSHYLSDDLISEQELKEMNYYCG